jgi:hypothetical protein
LRISARVARAAQRCPPGTSEPPCDRNIPSPRRVIEATTIVATRITTAVSTDHLYPPRSVESDEIVPWRRAVHKFIAL